MASPEPAAIRGTTSLYGVPMGSLDVPRIPIEIIHYLNGMFPDQLSLVTRLGSLERAEGARCVIRHLIEVHQEQQDTPNVLRRKILNAAGADGTGSAAAADGLPGDAGL